MLDLRRIQENKEKVEELLSRKGFKTDFSEVLAMDERRRAIIGETEALKAERNKVSASIPELKKAGKPVDAIFADMRALGEKIAALDGELKELGEKINYTLSCVPNIPDEDLLAGEKENNQVIKVFGEKPVFDFKMQNHVDICKTTSIYAKNSA